jgi:hypothetical protein
MLAGTAWVMASCLCSFGWKVKKVYCTTPAGPNQPCGATSTILIVHIPIVISSQVQISATEAMRHEYDSARKDVASAR